MKQTLSKGCEVEVCSKEEGFDNAWFRAILLENPTKSRSKKRRVRYLTLLEDSGSSPLIEYIEQRFIRPVPPDNLYEGVVLEEGSVVDVDQRDGWWTGLVIKKLEDDKFLISFDSPPDVIQSERKKLRPHLDLIRSKWVRPGIKELSQSMFSPGTMVEVSSVMTVLDKVEVVWVPAMIIKELEDSGEKRFIVKEGYKHLSCNGDEACPNMVVDSRCVRPTPPPFTVEEYTLLECVEAFRGTSWHQGIVRRVLSGKRYRVMLEATKEEAVFKFSDLRPCKVWENGVWHNGPKATGEVGKKRTVAVKNNNTSVIIHPKPKVNSIAKESVSLVTPSPVISVAPLRQTEAETQDKTAKESVSLVTPSPVITVAPLKQTEAETQDKTLPKKTIQPMRNQNSLGNDSTQENEDSEDNNGKRKRDVANVEETKADETTVFPFEKKLAVWKTLESMEVFKTDPKSPHFSPLKKTTEISGEMYAVGMTLTYHELLKEIKDLQLCSPISTLNRLNDYFAELEKHGFDIKAPQMRIQKLLSLKDRQDKIMEELKGVKRDIAEKENDKVETRQKILELKRREEEAAKEIAQMKSSATKIAQKLEDVELQFQTIVSAPW